MDKVSFIARQKPEGLNLGIPEGKEETGGTLESYSPDLELLWVVLRLNPENIPRDYSC